jgi:tRNA (cytidine/uridine-2'-O-)-methyltransferase
MRIALYEPDIPQNTGAILRLAACFGICVDIIEPAGFVMTDKRLKRAGMDYIDRATIETHASWRAFESARRATPKPARLALLTTSGGTSHVAFRFQPDDILMVGRESAGVPAEVEAAANARLRIPIREGLRSLNVATALAIVLGEALRQLDLYPGKDGVGRSLNTAEAP